MIFATVGTTKFPFDRLLKALDEVMLDLDCQEKLVVQKGASRYIFRYSKAEVFPELPFNQMLSYFHRARVVITHGGPSTIFLALKYGRNKPLSIPRIFKFAEHVDDHELSFIKFLQEKKEIEAVFPEDDISMRVKNYLLKPEENLKRRKVAASRLLIDRLIEYTNTFKR